MTLTQEAAGSPGHCSEAPGGRQDGRYRTQQWGTKIDQEQGYMPATTVTRCILLSCNSMCTDLAKSLLRRKNTLASFQSKFERQNSSVFSGFFSPETLILTRNRMV